MSFNHRNLYSKSPAPNHSQWINEIKKEDEDHKDLLMQHSYSSNQYTFPVQSQQNVTNYDFQGVPFTGGRNIYNDIFPTAFNSLQPQVTNTVFHNAANNHQIHNAFTHHRTQHPSTKFEENLQNATPMSPTGSLAGRMFPQMGTRGPFNGGQAISNPRLDKVKSFGQGQELPGRTQFSSDPGPFAPFAGSLAQQQVGLGTFISPSWESSSGALAQINHRPELAWTYPKLPEWVECKDELNKRLFAQPTRQVKSNANQLLRVPAASSSVHTTASDPTTAVVPANRLSTQTKKKKVTKRTTSALKSSTIGLSMPSRCGTQNIFSAQDDPAFYTDKELLSFATDVHLCQMRMGDLDRDSPNYRICKAVLHSAEEARVHFNIFHGYNMGHHDNHNKKECRWVGCAAKVESMHRHLMQHCTVFHCPMRGCLRLFSRPEGLKSHLISAHGKHVRDKFFCQILYDMTKQKILPSQRRPIVDTRG